MVISTMFNVLAQTDSLTDDKTRVLFPLCEIPQSIFISFIYFGHERRDSLAVKWLGI